MPSNNVMIAKEFESNKSIYYKIGCSCMSDAHTKTVSLEYDDCINDIIMTFYTDLILDNYFTAMAWWEKPWFRIKNALRILIKGRVEVQSDFIWTDSRAIDDFVKALEDGRDKLRKFKLNEKRWRQS